MKLTNSRRDLKDFGKYRTNAEPMQIVSGPIGNEKIHFEAPPSRRVPAEMRRFIAWFNQTGPGSKKALPALTRAGIAHLFFESIHPFEDGNGRIGRALAEKALAQTLGQPALTGLATEILAHSKTYYDALEIANKKIEISDWLVWFSALALNAQKRTHAQIEFLIAKTRLLDRLRDHINPRQEKALLRMMREGPQGFEGGMSAGNYSTITGASPATATRDLAALVDAGALHRTGELRHARYTLRLVP
jgi:Fic family protein